MANKLPIEIFMPPNVLKAKVGGGAALDLAAIERAEKAIDSLKGNFTDWLGEDVQRLVAARAAFAELRSLPARDGLFRASHDLRGQGATLGFPLIARIAGSLCKLLDGAPADQAPATLIDAHVNAIRAIARSTVKGDDTMAAVLAEELETRVGETLAQP